MSEVQLGKDKNGEKQTKFNQNTQKWMKLRKMSREEMRNDREVKRKRILWRKSPANLSDASSLTA